MTVDPGLSRYESLDDYPPLVRRAVEASRRVGYAKSCIPEVGALLRVLAASMAVRRIGETGTACGVGAAWIASGMAHDAKLITYELDDEASEAATSVFAQEPRVEVVAGDASEIGDHGPFDLLFTDGGFNKSEPEPLLALVASGGIVVLDDLTPQHAWTPALRAMYGEWRNDPVRVAWHGSGARTTELLVTRDESVLLAARI